MKAALIKETGPYTLTSQTDYLGGTFNGHVEQNPKASAQEYVLLQLNSGKT